VAAKIFGRDRPKIRSVTFRYAHRRKRDVRSPFRVHFRIGTSRFGTTVRARVKLRGGRKLTLSRAVRPCTRVSPR
jgi:hypothetical protein